MDNKDSKGQRAFRSGSTLSLPPEELDEKPIEQVDIDDEQTRENATYASLNGHPGWELIKRDFQQTIDAYRSGRPLQAAIKKGITDDELGKLTRTTNAIADELEQRILTVEAAAAALEEDDGRSKPASIRKGR